MTREEKIELLNKLLDIEKKANIGNLTRAERGEFQQWVNALEQETILDKIRAEIDRQEKWLLQAGYNVYTVDIAFDAIKLALAKSEE